MAPLAPVRALLPAAHGVPVAALKAAATSGASFLVVCPAGARAKAAAAALQAATKGAGLVLSCRLVARSGGVGDGRTGEDAEDVFGAGEEVGNDHTKDTDVFFVGAGDYHTAEGEGVKDETEVTDVSFVGAGEEEAVKGEIKATDVFFVGAGEEEAVKDDTKATDVSFVGSGEEEAVKDDTKATANVVFSGTSEMTMEELVLMFHKDTAMLLGQVKAFHNEHMLANLIASCHAIGEQIQQAKPLSGPEGRRAINRLIALHLRIVSCAGGVKIHNRGSYLPDIWSGDLHRLPCREKRAGTLMELLLYSMMLASAALGPSIGAVEWDFTSYD